MHRNLTPETIYIDETPENSEILRISNFESCSIIRTEEQTYDDTSFEKILNYAAPEIFKGQYNEKCDLWNCGAILYFMLCGSPAFDSNNEADIEELITSGNYNFDNEYFEEVSDRAKDLIKNLMNVDPDARLSAKDALNHEWFSLQI